ncbi:hypothetical protein [Streptomyces chartreusis]|uniref:hypothetical protein n=1 Tax=Streptomyces chartreusis TaxID=1969 RepID=UPI0037DD9552|nr:hypothetical protein OG938_48235 [Streptomyces chartreusis]
MADRAFSNDELRLYELLQQFLALSDDTEVAGTLILIGPKGSIVGDCVLSAADIEAAADALLQLNIRRADAAEGLAPAEPLPDDETQIAAVGDEAEAFLKNGGLL